MGLRRSISRRQKRAHVLRNKRRAILRTSTDSDNKTVPDDSSLFGSGSSEDGERAAKAYVYQTQTTQVKKIMSSCPCSLIPVRVVAYIANYFRTLNKSVRLVGRIGSLKPSRKNKTQSRMRVFIIWECATTGMTGCGCMCWDGGLYRSLDTFVYEDFTLVSDVTEHMQSIITFFHRYNESFRKRFPDYDGIITAPGYKLYRLFQFDVEIWKQTKQMKLIN